MEPSTPSVRVAGVGQRPDAVVAEAEPDAFDPLDEATQRLGEAVADTRDVEVADLLSNHLCSLPPSLRSSKGIAGRWQCSMSPRSKARAVSRSVQR